MRPSSLAPSLSSLSLSLCVCVGLQKGVESRIESISQVLCPGKAAQAIDIFSSYRQAVPRIRVGNPNNAELIAVACVYCAMRMNRDNVATVDDVTVSRGARESGKGHRSSTMCECVSIFRIACRWIRPA